MERVLKSANANTGALLGKVGFVLVGCVSYRFPFEKESAPRHETRFIYYMGKVEESGAMNPYVRPSGSASELQIVPFPDAVYAD
jgi:hypothetical protein